MKKIITATAFVLLLTATAMAQDWQSSVNEYGLRTAQVAADGETPDGAQKTTLAIVCRSGKDGSASLIYSILGADKMKRFSFADFEGPDAVTGNKKLTTIKVLTSGGAVTVITAVSGGYSDSDTFSFSLSANANAKSEVTRLTDAIVGGATKIVVTVRDNKNPKRMLQTEFPVVGAVQAVKDAMKGCGKP